MRRHLGLERALAGLADHPPELQDARLDPGADVEGAHGVRGGGRQHRLDDVAYVDVIAGLVAVAEDPGRPAFEQRAAKDRHYARLSERVLSRPVDVSEAKRDRREVVEPVIDGEVTLGRVLGLAVRRVWKHLGALIQRRVPPIPLAVDRASG